LERSAKHRRCLLPLLMLPLLLLYSDRTHIEDTTEIFYWVARQMKIDDPGRMPIVRHVSRQRLRTVFEKNNHRSYLRWRARYGELQAQKMLNQYLRNIIGLYDPDTDTIYVAQEICACKKRSILAHEMAHFFQYQRGAAIKQPEATAYAQRLQREAQAHQIEHLHLQAHCPYQKTDKGK
jgi:succinate dehydrogenase flavin-adding protein (antitoxin of CptAB toxin-antitoxin module)